MGALPCSYLVALEGGGRDNAIELVHLLLVLLVREVQRLLLVELPHAGLDLIVEHLHGVIMGG